MPFARPQLEELIQRTDQEVASRLGIGALLRRSILGALSRALSGAVHLLYGYLAWIARQVFPDTADAEHLDRWGAIWAVVRRPATSFEAELEFSGVDGSTVPAGTGLQRDDGTLYETTESAVIAGGTALAGVIALEPGVAANVTAGSLLTLVSPVAGVETDAAVQAGPVNGAEVESDTDYRARILARLQQPPQGGSAADYEGWALEVPGVTRAWVFPLHLGLGTVGLTFAVDDDPAGPVPTAGQVTAVQDHVDTLRPVTADLTVWAPTARPIAGTIALIPDSAELRVSVEAALGDLFAREAEPGGTLLISHVREAISTTPGETDHDVQAWDGIAAADVVFLETELGTLGAITWV